MAKTKISWCDYTFNPFRGCAKVSAGCRNCYAEQMAKRNPKVFGTWGPNGTRVVASDAYWKLPLRWNRAALAAGLEGDARPRVFCGSMCDVLEDREELLHWRAGLFDLIDATPNLQWMLLTKRPENIRRLMPPFVVQYVPEAGEMSYIEGVRENVWLGTTIENHVVAAKRLKHLLRVPAHRRFLSLEPLLGPIPLKELLWSAIAATPMARRKPSSPRPEPRDFIHEIIIGGESGSNARPCQIEWIRDLLRQADKAGIPARVKQIGSRVFEGGKVYKTGHPKGGLASEWPADLAKRAYAAKGGSLFD